VDLERHDLAALLKYSQCRVFEKELWFDYFNTVVEVASPPPFSTVLQSLSKFDLQRISESVAATCSESGPIAVNHSELLISETNSLQLSESDILIPEIVLQREVMVAVATGQQMIQDANDYYRARRKRIATGLEQLGIPDPNPHSDLWDWYHHWKEHFETYAQRRLYIREMYEPLVEQVISTTHTAKPSVPREPTGWERVDRTADKCHAKLQVATHEEDFQQIGLLCREALISLGQEIYNPEKHKTHDGVEPSITDAYRMIEAYLSAQLSGKKLENMRRYAKSSLALALELQHKRTADFRLSALCLESTSSLINLVSILEGRRTPSRQSSEEE